MSRSLWSCLICAALVAAAEKTSPEDGQSVATPKRASDETCDEKDATCKCASGYYDASDDPTSESQHAKSAQ